MISLHMRRRHIEFLENYITQQLWLSVFFQNSMRLGFSAIFYVFHYVSVNYQFESTSYTTRHNISLSIASRPCDILEYHTNGRPIPRSACFQFYPLCPVNCNFNFTHYILGCAWNARPFILGVRTRKNTHPFLVTTHFSSSLSEDPSVSPLSVYSELSLSASLWPNSYWSSSKISSEKSSLMLTILFNILLYLLDLLVIARKGGLVKKRKYCAQIQLSYRKYLQ